MGQNVDGFVVQVEQRLQAAADRHRRTIVRVNVFVESEMDRNLVDLQEFKTTLFRFGPCRSLGAVAVRTLVTAIVAVAVKQSLVSIHVVLLQKWSCRQLRDLGGRHQLGGRPPAPVSSCPFHFWNVISLKRDLGLLFRKPQMWSESLTGNILLSPFSWVFPAKSIISASIWFLSLELVKLWVLCCKLTPRPELGKPKFNFLPSITKLVSRSLTGSTGENLKIEFKEYFTIRIRSRHSISTCQNLNHVTWQKSTSSSSHSQSIHSFQFCWMVHSWKTFRYLEK